MNDASPRRFLIKGGDSFLAGGDSKAPITLTVMRAGLGIVMAMHGWAKLGNVDAWQATVAELGIPAPEVAAWLAIAGELGGGLGLLVGFLTPIAAFGVLATMITAIVTVHWGNGLFVQDRGYELPLMYALLAVYFMARGAGPLSIDAMLEPHGARAPDESENPTDATPSAEPTPTAS